jgi:hypothetical protein
MNRILPLLLLILSSVGIFAQKHTLHTLRLEARGDYQRFSDDGSKVDAESGFKGKFLNIRLDGQIGEHFNYSYRQRLNKPHKDMSYFDATDWLYLTYTKDRWSFSGGKQVIGIGGFEYDLAPIDVYFFSGFCSNVTSYAFGGSVAYALSKNDRLTVQVCESPFSTATDDIYAYNLLWQGKHGCWSTLYSLNMVEYKPGKFVNYMALGNRFDFDNVSLTLDLMNRTTEGHCFLGRDFSVMGEVDWKPCHKVNLFGKCTYDVNKSKTLNDACVPPGTELTRIGAGVEFFPLKDNLNDVRLHLAGHYTLGDVPSDYSVQPKQLMLTAGVTWRMDLASLLK